MKTFNLHTIVFATTLYVSAAPTAHTEGRDERRIERGAPRVGERSRPRAPKPLRVTSDTRLYPSGAYRPPVARYDIKPAPVRYTSAASRLQTINWHAPNHSAVANISVHTEKVSRINQTDWRTANNIRYAHMYDGHVHWYGFYDGPRFYWTRYEDSRWWWFDQAANRWLYWYDNYWWWHNPINPAVPYVVVNDIYYPYTEIESNPQLAPGVTPVPGLPPATSNAALNKAGQDSYTYISLDAQREVHIYGDRHEAFLYERTGSGEPHFLAFLASGVRQAQFSEPSGSHLQILLLMNDGSYDVFDAAGHSLLTPQTPQTSPP